MIRIYANTTIRHERQSIYACNTPILLGRVAVLLIVTVSNHTYMLFSASTVHSVVLSPPFVVSCIFSNLFLDLISLYFGFQLGGMS